MNANRNNTSTTAIVRMFARKYAAISARFRQYNNPDTAATATNANATLHTLKSIKR